MSVGSALAALLSILRFFSLGFSSWQEGKDI